MSADVSVQPREQLVRMAVGCRPLVQLSADHGQDGRRRCAMAHHVAEGEQEPRGRDLEDVVVVARRVAEGAPPGVDRQHRVVDEGIERGLETLEHPPQVAVLVAGEDLARGDVAQATRDVPQEPVEEGGAPEELAAQHVGRQLEQLAVLLGPDRRRPGAGLEAAHLAKELAGLDVVDDIAVDRDFAAAGENDVRLAAAVTFPDDHLTGGEAADLRVGPDRLAQELEETR